MCSLWKIQLCHGSTLLVMSHAYLLSFIHDVYWITQFIVYDIYCDIPIKSKDILLHSLLVCLHFSHDCKEGFPLNSWHTAPCNNCKGYSVAVILTIASCESLLALLRCWFVISSSLFILELLTVTFPCSHLKSPLVNFFLHFSLWFYIIPKLHYSCSCMICLLAVANKDFNSNEFLEISPWMWWMVVWVSHVINL